MLLVRFGTQEVFRLVLYFLYDDLDIAVLVRLLDRLDEIVRQFVGLKPIRRVHWNPPSYPLALQEPIDSLQERLLFRNR